MASLKAQRQETETARSEAQQRAGMSKVQEEHKRKLDERREMLRLKRAKLLGGQDEVDRLRKEKREKEAENFLQGLEAELGAHSSSSAVKTEDVVETALSEEKAP